MCTTRRHILAFAGTTLLSKLFVATLPKARTSGVSSAPTFDVDRLLDGSRASPGGVYCRRYVASATVMLFSLPLVSKAGVGSGYTLIEEGTGPLGKTVAIQFGAGSWPESARGLNRLGYIQEAVVEGQSEPRECAYLAFMTTSQEKTLDQAKKAAGNAGTTIPYSAAQGLGRGGGFAARVDRLQFPSQCTWRGVSELIGQARAEMAANTTAKKEQATESASHAPATFLYLVCKALLDPKTHTSGSLFFNNKQFDLQTEKENAAAAGALFAGKELASRADRVIRMSAMLSERRSGEKTPFRLWYEQGCERMPPLKFEYQARPFLRLSFEANPSAAVPSIRYAMKGSKESA